MWSWRLAVQGIRANWSSTGSTSGRGRRLLRARLGLADADLGKVRRRARQLGLAGGKTVGLQHERDDVEVLLPGEAVRVVLRHGLARLLEERRHRLPVPIREERWSDEPW